MILPDASTNAFILVIEDTLSMSKLLRAYLEQGGHRVEVATTGTAALDRLQQQLLPHVIVLDLNLPDLNGLQIITEVTRRRLTCSIIVVTSDSSLQTTIEAMRAGAYDYIVKPVNADRLNTTIRNALEQVQLRSKIAVLERSTEQERFCGFIGRSAAMQTIYRTIETTAPSTATVFITGESGTGKELVAEALHQLSPRHGKRFVALNCAAIPKDLMESDIFGHVRGGFTGAVSDRVGAAKQADGGTLFLDEICEMQLDLQSKLLRFLQTGTFQPVGGSRLERVNIRVVCATNRDPWLEVQAGRFREDLYYRLNVIPLRLPPLRERGEDVLLIARALLADYAREENRRFTGFDPSAEAALLSYGWPGNIRELQNVLRHAVVMHDGEFVTAEMWSLPYAASGFVTAAAARPACPPAGSEAGLPVAPTDPAHPADADRTDTEQTIVPLWQVEKAAIERAIRLCHGNIPRAAAFLGVSPSTIYRKRQSWDADKP